MPVSGREFYLSPFYRGDNHTIRLAFTDTEADAPVDLTGWSFFMTMKLNPFSDDDEAGVVVDLINVEGPEITIGNIDFSIPREQSEKLVPTLYFLDVQAKSPDGAITTLFKGRQQVLSDVTKRTE